MKQNFRIYSQSLPEEKNIIFDVKNKLIVLYENLFNSYKAF